ncbi:M20 metallopeptidase family protein [Glycomyces harbinensis]|uniref:Amidohydrolase n=1 Tax=Glycomyces harbinensis TaxID=58114 RepID=A0A1G6VCX0_9ACTN|nr:M20/M25/M40 family metallo-hydrolase [Glycomyces harbinensis]SDD50857.1 amidohydrolase [Glycomyces harbinensis]
MLRRTAPVTRRVVLGAVAVAAAGSTAPAYANSPNGLSARDIDDVADEFDADLIALRRDLHANPDGPGDEARTAGVVAGLLTAAGLEVTTGVGGHGVVAVLKGRKRGRTVAYRADMDAVPVQDQIGGGTAPAHLCGHDLHTAIGVGVAQVLARLRHRLRGTVVFFFQPAEETLTGAQAMIDDGALAVDRPEEIHALHCGPFPVGTFGVNPGVGLPGQDRGSVTVSGAGAAERAALLAAEIGALATVSLPEGPADLERIVADIQIPDGPLAEFVNIRARAAEPDADGRVEVEVVSRCWPEERYTDVRADVDRIAGAYGDAAVSFPDDPFPAMVVPEWEANALKRYLRRSLGRGAATVLHGSIPFSGEDFALFLDHLPGTFTYLGVEAPGAGISTSYPHFGTFSPDERAIGHGVRAMAGWLVERADREG